MAVRFQRGLDTHLCFLTHEMERGCKKSGVKKIRQREIGLFYLRIAKYWPK